MDSIMDKIMLKQIQQNANFRIWMVGRPMLMAQLFHISMFEKNVLKIVDGENCFFDIISFFHSLTKEISESLYLDLSFSSKF